MKKLFAVLLISAVLFSLYPFMIQTHAESTDKISPALFEELDRLGDDERIAVTVTASFVISDDERSQINEECAGLAGVDITREVAFTREKAPSTSDWDTYKLWLDEYLAWQDFRSYRHQKLKELRQRKITDFIDEMLIEPQFMDDGHYHIEYLYLPDKLYLTKLEIERIKAKENVTYIDIYQPPKQYNKNPKGIMPADLYEKLQDMQDDDRIWLNVRLNQLGPVDHELMETLTLEIYGLNLANGYRNDYPLYYQDARSRLNKDYNDYRLLVRYDNIQAVLDDDNHAFAEYPNWEHFTAYMTKAQLFRLLCDVNVRYVNETEPPPTEPAVPDRFDTEPVLDGCTPYESAFNRYVHSVYRDPIDQYDQRAEYDAYEELYEHQDAKDNTDWVLIFAYTESYPGQCHAVFDDVVICDSPSYGIFSRGLGFAIYDVNAKQFYGLDQAWEMDYKDLHEVFCDMMAQKKPEEFSGNISLIGDIDGDLELSIVDVTIIQRCHANLFEWNDDLTGNGGALEHSYQQYGFTIRYASDYDRDGERNITDATALQRRLVNLNYKENHS